MRASDRAGAPLAAARVREIIASYGAEPHRWPADERAAALAVIARDPDLAEALAAERRLDEALDHHPAPPAIAINPLALATAARRGPAVTATHRMGLWLPRVASLAAAAILGFAVGVSGVGSDRLATDEADTLALMMTLDEDWL